MACAPGNKHARLNCAVGKLREVGWTFQLGLGSGGGEGVGHRTVNWRTGVRGRKAEGGRGDIVVWQRVFGSGVGWGGLGEAAWTRPCFWAGFQLVWPPGPALAPGGLRG